ncbi:hypothetical protein CC2G_005817 [Coprinopsis cinerea AmutBmut pab1-1]|nr:hypothetical protein CC2G_005817 [Coprinopsis cinerea AmutBmut pab1-1]
MLSSTFLGSEHKSDTQRAQHESENYGSARHSQRGKVDPTVQQLESFVSKDPNSRYTFDSEAGSNVSELCRGSSSGGTEALRDCITLQMSSKQMFEAMQNQGFFCSLPSDPAQTHMECKPMPK